MVKHLAFGSQYSLLSGWQTSDVSYSLCHSWLHVVCNDMRFTCLYLLAGRGCIMFQLHPR